jgi:hypothetical protein
MAQGGGTCAYFDGTDDYLTTGGQNYGYNTITTEFWAYATDWTPSSTHILVTLQTDGSGKGYKIELRSSDIRFYLVANSAKSITVSTSSLSTGWHHIAATYDGVNMNLWVDGETNANIEQTGNVDYGTYELRIGTHSDGTDDFDGYIDELRFWRVSRSQSEIQSLMHISGTTVASYSDLRGYYRFESNTTPAYLENEGNASGNDLTNSGCSFEDQKTPIGDFPSGYTTDPEALWRANGTGWSDESTGMALRDYNTQSFGTSEFYAFANNNLTGTSTSDLPTDVDLRASTIWFIDAEAEDRINLNFDLSDFGATAIEVSGLAAANYKLLKRTGTSGDFVVTKSGTSVSSGEIYFEDYDPSETDAYFTIGRDNDLATVTTTAAASIGFMEATLGGEVTDDGGSTITEQGICYNKTGTPTTDDIKKKDYSGQNPFTKTIYDLVPNTTYYVRAYAINSEGTSYGGVQSFTTTSATNWTPSGAGTSESPYQIANLNNLVWMMETESSWNSYFELTADIDASASSSWDGGKGFAPIGRQTPDDDHFNGLFEGNNHTISNLYINRPNTNDVGLFGYTDRNYSLPTSDVRNLGLVSVNFTGGYRTAGLIARSSSDVTECYVTGSVTGDASNSVAGGFIAQSHETVSNCYSRASVNAEFQVAGFISFNNGDTEKCYSTGLVSGEADDQDGFCNDADGHGDGTLTDCFWDTQTSNQSSSDGGTSATTTQMTNETTTDNIFLNASWDFKGVGDEGIWNIGNDRNNAYPYLDWEHPSDPGTLPVVLSTFTAQFIENTPTIHWSTQSETDNMGWLIYRNNENIFSSSEIISNMIEGHGTTTQQQFYTYEDNLENPEVGDTYYYWLESIDYGGIINHYDNVAILTIPDNHGSTNNLIPKPERFGLFQNEPNPVINSTRIAFNLTETAQVDLNIYNLKGQLVKTLYSGFTSKHTIMWNGKDSNGKELTPGVYFYNLIVNGKTTETKKLILMK